MSFNFEYKEYFAKTRVIKFTGILILALIITLFFHSYTQSREKLSQVDPLLSLTFALSLFVGIWLRNIYLRKRYALRYTEKQWYSLDIINFFAMLMFANVVWVILIFINAIFIQIDISNIITHEVQKQKTIFDQGVAIITLVVVVVTAYYLVAMQGTYNQAKDFLKTLEKSMLDIKAEIENLDEQRLLIQKLRYQGAHHLHATLLSNMAYLMKDKGKIEENIVRVADINYLQSTFITKILNEEGRYRNCDSNLIDLLKSNMKCMKSFLDSYSDLDDLSDALKNTIFFMEDYLYYVYKENKYLPKDEKIIIECLKLIDEIKKKIV